MDMKKEVGATPLLQILLQSHEPSFLQGRQNEGRNVIFLRGNFCYKYRTVVATTSSASSSMR